jgi:hypothetical protein
MWAGISGRHQAARRRQGQRIAPATSSCSPTASPTSSRRAATSARLTTCARVSSGAARSCRRLALATASSRRCCAIWPSSLAATTFSFPTRRLSARRLSTPSRSALTTVGQQARVTIVPQNGATLVDADAETLGGHQVVGRHDGAVTLGIGAHRRRHAQARRRAHAAAAVDTKDPEKAYCEVTLDYNATTGASLKPVQRVALGYRRDGGDDGQGAALPHRRSSIVSSSLRKPGHDVERRCSPRRRPACRAADRRVGAAQPNNKLVAALVADLRGQITEAFQRYDWFNRAGASTTLPSLCRSHALEVCSNFKDVGLQAYAGALFDEMQQHRRRDLLQAAGAQARAAASRRAQAR